MPEPDGGPTMTNGETTIWYDEDGEQHVTVKEA